MRTKYFIVMFASVPLVLSGAALGQVPPVGPGHCVANCGGGGGGGGSRGGGGGGSSAAIGSAIGLGMAIGGAILQQQQTQQNSGAATHRTPRPTKESVQRNSAKDKKAARKKDDTDDKPGNTTTSKPTPPSSKTGEKQDTPAKTPAGSPPSNNLPTWSDCTSRGGVWGNPGCGHPTFPTSAANNQRPQLQRIPYFVPIVPNQFVDALPCPQGFIKVGETFYGGTKCAPGVAESKESPVVLADVAPLEFTDPPPRDKSCQPPRGWKLPSRATPIDCQLDSKEHCKILGKLVSAIPDEKYREFVSHLKFERKNVTFDSTKLATTSPSTPTSNESMSSSGADTIFVGEPYFDKHPYAQLILLIFESGKNEEVKEEGKGRPPNPENRNPPAAVTACLRSMTADLADPTSENGLAELSKNFGH